MQISERDVVDLDFSGRTVLVTGAKSGIGAACVSKFEALGAWVVSVDACHIAETESEGGLVVPADITDPDDVATMISHATTRSGSIDVAVNCAGAGIRARAAVGQTAVSEWRRLMDVNLHGAFLCMQAEVRAMDSGGAIVNVASVMGKVGTRGGSPYVAAKHGLVGLTKAAALDYAHLPIRVNAVAPGFIDTPLLGNPDDATRRQFSALHPLGRLGSADEVAAAIVFLASPAASFITGAVLPVDGGFLAQ